MAEATDTTGTYELRPYDSDGIELLLQPRLDIASVQQVVERLEDDGNTVAQDWAVLGRGYRGSDPGRP